MLALVAASLALHSVRSPGAHGALMAHATPEQKTAADDLPFIDGDSANVGAEEGGARSNILSSLDS